MDLTSTELRYRRIIVETGHQLHLLMDAPTLLGSESVMRLPYNKMGMIPTRIGALNSFVAARPTATSLDRAGRRTVRMTTETLSWMIRRGESHNGLLQYLIRKDNGCCRDEMGRGGTSLGTGERRPLLTVKMTMDARTFLESKSELALRLLCNKVATIPNRIGIPMSSIGAKLEGTSPVNCNSSQDPSPTNLLQTL